MNGEIITHEEAMAKRAELRQKIKQLHPEDCPFCGGYHEIRLTRTGQPIANSPCCDDMMREVLKLEHEVFGGDGGLGRP